MISAKKYMQLLMTEEEQTGLIMLILTQNLLRADMYVLFANVHNIFMCILSYLCTLQ